MIILNVLGLCVCAHAFIEIQIPKSTVTTKSWVLKYILHHNERGEPTASYG
jgi:hypothetical protein